MGLLTFAVTVIEGVDHFIHIFRIMAELLCEIFPNGIHVQVVVLHEVHFVEDALGETGARYGTRCCQIDQGLLLVTRHLEARLLGAVTNDLVVSVRVLAAVVYVILIHSIRFVAIDLYGPGAL